jgi:hypothetical protein
MSGLLGAEHVLRLDPLVELLLCEVAEPDGLLLQGCSVLVRRLGNLGRGIVANVRVQRRHQLEKVNLYLKKLVRHFRKSCF